MLKLKNIYNEIEVIWFSIYPILVYLSSGPYQLRAISVSIRGFEHWTWYGVGMDLTRSWYRLGYIRIRMKRKKMSCTSLLAIWHYGNMTISLTRESHTYNTQYKLCILFQFKTQKPIFYFNLKYNSNKQIFCKSQKPVLLYHFEIKLILLPNILIAIIGITTE